MSYEAIGIVTKDYGDCGVLCALAMEGSVSDLHELGNPSDDTMTKVGQLRKLILGKIIELLKTPHYKEVVRYLCQVFAFDHRCEDTSDELLIQQTQDRAGSGKYWSYVELYIFGLIRRINVVIVPSRGELSHAAQSSLLVLNRFPCCSQTLTLAS